MAAKKSSPKTAPAALPRKRDPNAFEVVKSEDTKSQALAKLTTTSSLAAVTLKRYSGAGDEMDVADLLIEMRKAGDEVVAGDMGRVERMLANQAMTLDAIFNDMAQRSGRQDSYKGIEVLMRLALKAQAQARSTAEALALLKNPMPYIKQANMTTGPQQVNNTYAGTPSHSGIQSGAGNSRSEPNKLLEADHGQRLDIGSQAAAGRANQKLETVG
ncbi:hypothetical protein [Simplicispira lacusdiani]|uniref:hypothetical protein n=1 Tax=Simplicispira lacusdiani TaxID=2213010 RepID=UPI001300AE49|nr:hypothetical protein [Simplicispira lacusdiani]